MKGNGKMIKKKERDVTDGWMVICIIDYKSFSYEGNWKNNRIEG